MALILLFCCYRTRGIQSSTTCPSAFIATVRPLQRKLSQPDGGDIDSSVTLEDVDGLVYRFRVHTGERQSQFSQVVGYHHANLVGEARKDGRAVGQDKGINGDNQTD